MLKRKRAEKEEKKNSMRVSAKTKNAKIADQEKREGENMGKEEARGWREKFKKKFRIRKKELTETIKAQKARMSETLSKKISEKINENIGTENHKIIGMLKKKIKELKREADVTFRALWRMSSHRRTQLHKYVFFRILSTI